MQVPLGPAQRMQHGSLVVTSSWDLQGVVVASSKLPLQPAGAAPQTKAVLMTPEVSLAPRICASAASPLLLSTAATPGSFWRHARPWLSWHCLGLVYLRSLRSRTRCFAVTGSGMLQNVPGMSCTEVMPIKGRAAVPLSGQARRHHGDLAGIRRHHLV